MNHASNRSQHPHCPEMRQLHVQDRTVVGLSVLLPVVTYAGSR